MYTKAASLLEYTHRYRCCVKRLLKQVQVYWEETYGCDLWN